VQHDHAVGAAMPAVRHLDLDGVETVRYRHRALPSSSDIIGIPCSARQSRKWARGWIVSPRRRTLPKNTTQGLPGAPQQARSQSTDPASDF